MNDLQKKFTDNTENLLRKTNPPHINSMFNSRLRAKAWTDGDIPVAEFDFEPDDFDLNFYGGVHGGITCTVFDVCAGLTCATFCDTRVTTVSINVNYLSPIPKGLYTVRVELVHAGRALLSTVCKIISHDTGKVCATCEASYMHVVDGFKVHSLT